jgi:hypothetical protein
MLADRSDEDVAALYADCELVTPTGRRLDGLDELLRILSAARRRGYAENVDDTALGLHCLAAPVGMPGRVLAAVTLCVPTGRMSAARKREMLPDLLRAAEDLAPRPGNGDKPSPANTPPRANTPPPGNGKLAPPAFTQPNQSSKLAIATIGASTQPADGADSTPTERWLNESRQQ